MFAITSQALQREVPLGQVARDARAAPIGAAPTRVRSAAGAVVVVDRRRRPWSPSRKSATVAAVHTGDTEVTRLVAGDDGPMMTVRPTRRMIGRYRLSYELASGGQATVYVGVAEGPSGFEKVVAIKVLHGRHAKDAAAVSQFLDEARLAAQLTHPSVCGVIDFGIDGDDHFLVMEFIPGVTVAQLLMRAVELEAEGRLDKKRWGALAGLVFSSVAEGLHAVHDLRDATGRRLHVVHRDVTPKNIIVGFDGSVRLMDFGIAQHDARMTQSIVGSIKGTASYMSPEQARGEPVDVRTDIWSLGVVAWEFLARQRLFKRALPMETMLALVQGPIPRISEIDSMWTAPVDAALEIALARDLSQRTNDARSFAARLALGVGHATAAELADWIRRALPHAEVESRTLVDLARQSAGQLPSAVDAVEERRRHLAAIGLLQSARAMFPELERAIAEGRAAAAVDERLVECRMTLLQASREWPADADIRASLDTVLTLAARHELRRENAAAARALITQLDTPRAALEAEVSAVERSLSERREAALRLENLARENDLRVGFRSRMASLIALIFGAIAIAFLTFVLPERQLTHEFLLRIAGTQLLLTLVGLVVLRKHVAKNSAGRRAAGLIVAIAVTGLLQRAVSARVGITPAAMLTIDLIRHGLATTAAGLLVPRTAWATIVPAAALGLALLLPAETPRIVSISSVVTLVVVTVLFLWDLGRAGRDAGSR